MDHLFGQNDNELRSLAWLAFFAEQRGWTELADDIASDTAELYERHQNIQRKLATLRPDRYEDAEDQAA